MKMGGSKFLLSGVHFGLKSIMLHLGCSDLGLMP